MPARSAAAITNSPGFAGTARPSMVIDRSPFWSATRRLRNPRGAVDDVVLELITEVADRRRDGRHRRGSERADRGLPGRPRDARADVVGQIHEEIEVVGTAVAVDDPLQDLLEPVRAFSTRGALATRLTREEAHATPR